MTNLPFLKKYLFIAAVALTILIGTLTWNSDLPRRIGDSISSERHGNPKPEVKKHPVVVHKPSPSTESVIEENFPLAAKAQSASDLPPVPSFNLPPKDHVPEATPLLIGFTRTWPLLQQTVVGYITAGWPASDIYVVDNTGTMNSNELGLLTLQNPFYLDYHRLKSVYGVNVVTTPTLLTFAQLQNFYMHFALQNKWDHYFWSHMDVAILSDEAWKDSNGNYKSIYMRAVDTLREVTAPDYGKWGIVFFAYDHLELVNLEAFMHVGGWDTGIGFYFTDCDMHFRIGKSEYKIRDVHPNAVHDVADSHQDLLKFYRRKPGQPGQPWGGQDELGSEEYRKLKTELEQMSKDKVKGEGGRNRWHTKQNGGQGEPFHIPAEAFQTNFVRAIEFGKETFRKKWAWGDCGFGKTGLTPEDAWNVERIDFVPDEP